MTKLWSCSTAILKFAVMLFLNAHGLTAGINYPARLRNNTSWSFTAFATNYNYGAMEQEMIRNRLVIGIRNQALLKMLQLDVDLMLNKAKHAIRQQQMVQEQQSILNRGYAAFPNVDSIRRNDRSRQRDRRDQQQQSSRASGGMCKGSKTTAK